ncbi:rod shape-determining protein MreD [Rhodovulum iodosum]|uniref:Rod shape-determining protein MreD n=1 Tax=Rhodovulum iodosum TaxID=68291 RepID=A0ABV3XWX7_9RHOB|nr:rod shape-determining protein MreD [Rhodovulum robiginosum]RSK32248.1 rod shape-determining protein MreD [Rhodovulum robiginosum]
MVDPLTTRRWLYRALFAALATLLLFLRLLPLDTMPRTIPGPDLLMCLIFAWVQRRPDYIPCWLLVGAVLVFDMMLMRPPGVWTALVLLGAEFLRSRQQVSAEMPFGVEWLMVGAVTVVATLAYGTILAIAVVDHASLAKLLVQAVTTLAAYPLVVFLSAFVLGVRQASLGEITRRAPAR